MLIDSPKYVFDPDAIAVLDAHIKAGYGDYIPDWEDET